MDDNDYPRPPVPADRLIAVKVEDNTMDDIDHLVSLAVKHLSITSPVVAATVKGDNLHLVLLGGNEVTAKLVDLDPDRNRKKAPPKPKPAPPMRTQ